MTFVSPDFRLMTLRLPDYVQWARLASFSGQNGPSPAQTSSLRSMIITPLGPAPLGAHAGPPFALEAPPKGGESSGSGLRNLIFSFFRVSMISIDLFDLSVSA